MSFKIAIIGQSAFSASFLKTLIEEGYQIAGIFTIPDDKNGREDIFATTAKQLNIPVFKIKSWRIPPETNKALPDVFEQYKSINADLNVLPYCNQFIPMEVINFPKFKSINYHPSLLPLHRGAAAINWTLINGDKEAGFTIFWTDDGLDTGPILMKKSCFVKKDDTVDSLYSRFMFPEGINSLVESVSLIRSNQAPKIVQPLEGASYEPILRGKEERTKINFNSLDTAEKLHNFIRGMDKVPGAWTNIRILSDSNNQADKEYEKVKLFSSSLYHRHVADHGLPDKIVQVELEGLNNDNKSYIHKDGLIIFPLNDNNRPINIGKIQICSSGKMIKASLYGSAEANKPPLVFNNDELDIQEKIRKVWQSILPVDGVTKSTDFFASGAGSMDVVRLVEEVKDIVSSSNSGLEFELENEDVYMETQFDDFINLIIRRLRGEDSANNLISYEPVCIEQNNMQLIFPNKLFINNEFVNSIGENNPPMDTINPANEEKICSVQVANRQDVDKAVKSAKMAFNPKSPWRQMNPRARGRLLYKLADLMEQHKKELATLESIDSGAVYTLALKTHIGMSIAVFRYYAGLCGNYDGETIPIDEAKPNGNICYTFKEPIGVCGLITPWNYPLMMVAWKVAACLCAGNTVVIKPAQACPLTALKWAELVAKAGFPPGVVNVVPGRGSECGQAILEHPDIAKIGFTGSTPTGKHVMKCSSEFVRKVSLELGGKSPLIIFGDCDLKLAVKNAMSAVFFNKGENCIAAGRLFVEASIYDKFIKLVLEETKKMKIGDPLDRSTAHGPQNHLSHLKDLIEFCKRGCDEGAKLVYGGHRIENKKGYYFMPTIFKDVQDDMFIAKEESFGPIMIISKFDNDDIEDVIWRANKTNYGLASGVFTENFSKATQVSRQIKAGTCFINTYNKTDVAAPFGGIKESGFGKDLGKEALKEYTTTKVIIAQHRQDY